MHPAKAAANPLSARIVCPLSNNPLGRLVICVSLNISVYLVIPVTPITGVVFLINAADIFVAPDPTENEIRELIRNGGEYIQENKEVKITLKNDVDKLIEKNIIKDLLFDKHYINYNLSSHCGVSDFLTRFLSLVLISDTFIGDEIKLDIEYYNENQRTFDYFFNTLNSDICVFNTTI